MEKRIRLRDKGKKARDDASEPIPEEKEPRISGVRQNLGVSADTSLTFRRSIFNFGRMTAHATGDSRVNQKRLEAVQEHAKAMAKEQQSQLFAPDTLVHDQIRQEEFERNKQEIPEIEEQIRAGEDDVRKRRNAFGEMGDEPQAVETPWWLAAIATLVIALSVSPTFKDFLFNEGGDSGLLWILSILPGLFAGAVISYCIIGTFRETSSEKILHWFGLSAGILFSVAVGMIRLVGAETDVGLILAIGLALLEISVLLFLEMVGRGLRFRYQEFLEKKTEYDRRARVYAAAQEELSYWQKRQQELREKIETYTVHILTRESGAHQIETLIDAAVKAVTDGFMLGINENELKLLGVPVSELPEEEEDWE